MGILLFFLFFSFFRYFRLLVVVSNDSETHSEICLQENNNFKLHGLEGSNFDAPVAGVYIEGCFSDALSLGQ